MTYRDKIEALRQASPEHPLLRLLGAKETPVNALILDRELRKVRTAPPAPAAIEAETEVEDDGIDAAEDSVLVRLRMQQSSLFGDRRKLSNSFHDCDSDADRRRVSEQIQIIQRRIELVRADIKTYKDLGRLPEPDEKYPIPEDPFRLLALRDSLRASISRKRGECKRLVQEGLEEKPGAAEGLEKAVAKLNHLQNHLQRVQKTIQARNIQPGRLLEG